MSDNELSLSNYINLFCEGWRYLRSNKYPPDIADLNSREAFMDGYEAAMFRKQYASL